jgi:hypothetical protein
MSQAQIAPLLKMKPADILLEISGTSKYANIKKKVDATVYRKLEALGVPWLSFDPIPVRVYPNGAMAR